MANLEDIEIITDWGPGMRDAVKVPSVITYSPASIAGERQWGSDISYDAVTMVNTKMELDVQDNKLDELELLLQVLRGTSNLDFDHIKRSRGLPDYTWKPPEEVLEDYLTKIFEQVIPAFDQFITLLRESMVVDLVITVPVVIHCHIFLTCRTF